LIYFRSNRRAINLKGQIFKDKRMCQKRNILIFKEELHMYLVKTTNGDKILNSADAVKSIKKEDIEKIYFLTEVNYDSVISNADIRDCIYSYLKGKQLSKETVVDYVASVLDVKKNEVSKVITAMKREKIIYVERDYGSIGID
jgi:hypothetical protein